jgi:uncharacterized protein (DUF433 family)
VEIREIVSRNPEVVSGELVFAGTRVPVRNLIDYLKAGDSLERFLDEFPAVSREQAEAYLEMSVAGADALRQAHTSAGDWAAEEIPETEWLAAASSSGAFDFLTDPREDVYSVEDGRPFVDEG